MKTRKGLTESSLPVSLAAIAACCALLAACSGKEKSENAPGSSPAADGIHSGSKERPQVAAPTPFKAPPQYVGLVSDYRSSWSNLSGFEHSGLHWGQFISIYVNKEPERYVENFLEYVRVYLNEDVEEDEELADSAKHFKPYSVGTVFLKEHYVPTDGKPGKPLSVALMIKREPGYDPPAGDWEFAQYNADGQLLFSGKSNEPIISQVCIKCHQNMAERDYVFSTFCTLAAVQK